MTRSWPAIYRYARDGRVDWDSLCTDYGDHEVPAIIDAKERETMRLNEAVDLIKQQKSHTVYIKDWHLVRSARMDAQGKDPDRLLPYRTPALFADDCKYTDSHIRILRDEQCNNTGHYIGHGSQLL